MRRRSNSCGDEGELTPPPRVMKMDQGTYPVRCVVKREHA